MQVCDNKRACATSNSPVTITNLNPVIGVDKAVAPGGVSEGGVGSQTVTCTYKVNNQSASPTDPVTITSLNDRVLGPPSVNSGPYSDPGPSPC